MKSISTRSSTAPSQFSRQPSAPMSTCSPQRSTSKTLNGGGKSHGTPQSKCISPTPANHENRIKQAATALQTQSPKNPANPLTHKPRPKTHLRQQNPTHKIHQTPQTLSRRRLNHGKSSRPNALARSLRHNCQLHDFQQVERPPLCPNEGHSRIARAPRFHASCWRSARAANDIGAPRMTAATHSPLDAMR